MQRMKNAVVDSSTTSSPDTEPKAKKRVASQDATRECQAGARSLTVTAGTEARTQVARTEAAKNIMSVGPAACPWHMEQFSKTKMVRGEGHLERNIGATPRAAHMKRGVGEKGPRAEKGARDAVMSSFQLWARNSKRLSRGATASGHRRST